MPIRDVIYEHRIYLPSVGFFMAVAAGVASIAACRQQYRTSLWSATLLLCLVFTACTIARNNKWSNEMVLWQDVLKKSPNKARPNHSIGVLYFRKFMPEKALSYLVRAVELDPGTNKHWVGLNNTIAIIGKYAGRCSNGMQYQTSVFDVNPAYANPWWAISYNNLGLAYDHLGNQYLARENFLKAVNLNPVLDIALYNLAVTGARLGDTSTATAALKKLRTINSLLEQTAVKTIREQALPR